MRFLGLPWAPKDACASASGLHGPTSLTGSRARNCFRQPVIRCSAGPQLHRRVCGREGPKRKYKVTLGRTQEGFLPKNPFIVFCEGCQRGWLRRVALTNGGAALGRYLIPGSWWRLCGRRRGGFPYSLIVERHFQNLGLSRDVLLGRRQNLQTAGYLNQSWPQGGQFLTWRQVSSGRTRSSAISVTSTRLHSRRKPKTIVGAKLMNAAHPDESKTCDHRTSKLEDLFGAIARDARLWEAASRIRNSGGSSR